MIDQEHLEQTGLHPLGLLEEGERLLYDRELRVNPHLRAALRETRDQLAAVALTAPQAAPPSGALTAIERRLGLGRPQVLGTVAASLRRVRFQPAWAAAAALALLSSWLGITHYQNARRLAGLEAQLAALAGTTGEVPASSTWEDPPAPAAAGDPDVVPGTPSRVARGTDRTSYGSRVMRPISLPPGARGGLDRILPIPSISALPADGIADLRVMEMHPPGTAASPRRERRLLVSRVAEALAASSGTLPTPEVPPPDAPAASPPAPPPPAPAVLRGQGSSPSSDLIIEQGGTVNINALNLHPDAQVVHRNFPPDSAFSSYGLSRLDADRVWDGNGGIWYRQADGRTYLGQKAPGNFQPPDPDDPGSDSPSLLRPAPEPVPASAPADPAAVSLPGTSGIRPAPDPYALPVIASDGQGMIVTQNLPDPAEGEGYALWSHDAAGGPPVLLGFLPPSGGVNGVFAFDLPKGLPIPEGYRITHQVLTDFSKPGTSILQGP